MSLHNRFVLPLVLSAIGVLVACGGSGSSFTPPVPPPSGGFTPANLNGTYVFSSSGTDTNGAPYAIVGTFTANGSGGITGGVLDLNDAEFPTATPTAIPPVANAAISGGSYSLGVDGRGQVKLNTSVPLFSSPIILGYVLQDSSHGLVIEFDGNASGSGSLDLQASGTPVGTYAFIFSGAYSSAGAENGVSFSTVGNFTLPSGSSAMTGLEDINSSGIPSADTLSGTFALGPSSNPATQISAIGSSNYSITYDVFAIDATHLKFIEMDSNGTLSGDAFAQSSATMPTGSLAFSLIGGTSSVVTAAGGFIITDGNGNITNSSTEDINSSNGTVSTAPVGFSGLYTAGGAGRYTLNSLAGFVGATEFAAYPSTGGVLLLEIDSDGVLAGAAYTQSSTAVPDPSQGYAFNLSGTNLGASTGSSAEVDDIAEFATAASGLTLTGITDENFAPGGSPNFALALSGSYTAPTSGRGQMSANAGNSTTSTLNGGFAINYYTVDGTTFPFIEVDNGQVAAGVFVKQNSSSSSSAAAKSHLFAVQSVVHPRIARKQN